MALLQRRAREILEREAEALGTTPEELERAVVANHFGLAPGLVGAPLPAGYPEHPARVYRALHELGGAASSVQLAQHLKIHRGNVDRHLSRLRADGYVARAVGRGVHVVVEPDDQGGQLAS